MSISDEGVPCPTIDGRMRTSQEQVHRIRCKIIPIGGETHADHGAVLLESDGVVKRKLVKHQDTRRADVLSGYIPNTTALGTIR